MELEGEIKEIIFQNEINSYTIAVFETEKEEVTVVGYLPFIVCGDNLKITGNYIVHPDYGKQFKIDTFEKVMPKTLASLERYLANGTIKGIGPATAQKIVEKFGEETIQVFKFEPQKLAQIKGITIDKAEEMSEEFNKNWEIWQIVGYLEKFGVSVQNAKNVYKELGMNAIKEIENNPYILVDIVNNVDFKQIDKIALNSGIEYNNDKRIKSAVKYALMISTINGHCNVLEENLITFLLDLLNVTKEEIKKSIVELRIKDEIIVETRNDLNWVYLSYYYKAELNVAEKIMQLNNFKNIKKITNLDKTLKQLEEQAKIELSKKQKEAIKNVNDNNVCIITGGPGTGKTTIIKFIIDLYKKQQKKTVLCAPTGRAAKRMTETTGEDAKTLHRLLEIGKVEEGSYRKNVDYKGVMIDADVIIVDEMSMVDIFLMNYLVNAIYKGTKLILVGDVDQLPSVGPGSVLENLIDSKKITTVILNKIFRQAAKSKIIINAHRVNEGEVFLTNNFDKKKLKDDFFFINESNQNKILEQIVSLCSGRLKKANNYDFFKNIQIITPTKKGILGTKELNKVLQKELNPSKNSKKERQALGSIFRIRG